MSFKLNVDGIDVQLTINSYRPANRHEDIYDQWCHCDVSFSCENYLSYKLKSADILLSYEVENLETALTELLNGEIKTLKVCRFIEPDFIFVLYPKEDLSSYPEDECIRSEFDGYDISVEWRVHFWNNWPTDNFLNITLDRDEITALRDYLTSVINRKRIPKN
ncbi:MAG: hypothetical protein IJ298_09805 [Ruminococcus sp.]|nr:hypothetical protein [Ruminococcus sp.]